MFESPFTSYAYSYPHKSAYREISPALSLSEAWAGQNQDSLFLYLHVPFCEFRCGFCNLFTLSRPGEDLPSRYLKAVRRQAEQVRSATPDARFARLALGGGTPTFLNLGELEELLGIVSGVMQVDAGSIPSGCEASPATVDPAKLRMLGEFGIDRISLGVQSFDEAELRAIGRPQKGCDVERAIEMIRQAQIPTLNLDLIYGGSGQSVNSWMRSVERAVEYHPEEIYLYPLYVRDLTGLGRVSDLVDLPGDERRDWDRHRLNLYREARDCLLGHGYEQVSLRMFRLPRSASVNAPVYCCQSDAMMGLGCGARSYTDDLHYSCEYAVGTGAVRQILHDYVQRDRHAFSQIDYGFRLDREDQLRRFLIMSLLQCEGLIADDYTARFGTSAIEDFPSLEDLATAGYLSIGPEHLRLTQAGIEHSDAIGPWLNSAKVRELESTYQCR